MTGEDAAQRIARLLPTPFLRGYARGKLRSDPVYAAALERLRPHSAPLFDLGCGIGLFAFFLREHGLAIPILGVDHDPRKVAIAAGVASSYDDLDFRQADAREAIPSGMNVVALDILHYFRDEEQTVILRSMAAAVPAGGVAIIRDAVRDGSLRYRVTAVQEMFSRAIRWLKAERLNFPTRARIVAPFRDLGFQEEVVPLWGRTPFNNYLFVFRRSGDGTTNEKPSC